MEKQEIRNTILDILTSKKFMSLQINAKDITDETSLINEIGLDSIQILELIAALENTFKFSIDTQEVSLDIFDRFSVLIDYVAENVNK